MATHPVPAFLMAGYLYNTGVSESPLTDPEWDALCGQINEQWENITHPHKHLIKREHLGTATAMYLTEEYLPSITKHAAMIWKNNHDESIKI